MKNLSKQPLLIASLALNLILVVGIVYTLNYKRKPQIKDINFFTEYYKVDNRILFIGNSIIKSGNWNQLLNNNDIVNLGISGISSYEIFMQFDALFKGKPKKVFFEMGINDIRKAAPLQVLMENFHRILYAVKSKSPLTKIYFISVMPINHAMESPKNPILAHNDMIDQLNNTIKSFTEKFGVNYIEVNSLLKDKEGNLDPNYSIDGVHLNALGYEKIKPVLKENVEQ